MLAHKPPPRSASEITGFRLAIRTRPSTHNLADARRHLSGARASSRAAFASLTFSPVERDIRFEESPPTAQGWIAPSAAMNEGAWRRHSQNCGRACSSRPPRRTAPDPQREPGRIVGLHRQPAQRRSPHRRLEARPGILRMKRRERLFLVHADDQIVIAGHADVGDEGGAARQDAVVGGRRMGVRADHEARAAVEEMTHRLFLARRLGVEVDDRGVARLPSGQAASSRSTAAKGSSSGSMKMRPMALTTSTRAPSSRSRPPPRRGPACRGEIDRADQARLALDEDQRLALIEGMIADRDASAPASRNSRQIASVMPKPPAAFSPLTTTKSSFQSRSAGQALETDGAAAAADDVADEEMRIPLPAGSRRTAQVQRALSMHVNWYIP